jgi:DNA-binding transcriptional ArsR family regulator
MSRAPATLDAFNAVAEERRRDILDLLADGERPVEAIVAALGMTQPQVSKRLRVLREVGLVEASRRGRHRVYRFTAEGLRPLHEWMKAYDRYWSRHIDKIKERAERAATERGAHKLARGKREDEG